jgi:hypothetical protein
MHDTWMRLADAQIVTLDGLLGDQLIWHDADGVAQFTRHDVFLRDHRQITLH